jgi:hypothetical protein
MKVAIQGLGEVPVTIELVLEKEKPNFTYIICSDFQLKYVATQAGYKKTNELIIKDAAKKVGTKVIFCKCDVFDPKSISKTIRKILQKIDIKKDEILINYTGGSAVVRLLLGAIGVMLAGFARVRLIYAIQYREGIKFAADQTELLREVFPNDLQLLLDFIGKLPQVASKIRRKSR